MSTPNAEQVRAQAFDLVGQGQDATMKLMGALSENWAALARGGAASAPGAMVPGDLVDRVYDTGVQMLEMQRAMAHGVLGAVRPAMEAFTAPATTAR